MEQVRNFVDAIASGDNLEAEAQFNQALSQKVGDALETKRQEVANALVTGHVPQDKENSD
jgi:hypothetical protein